MGKTKSIAKPAEKQAPTPTIPLDAITIRWHDGHPGETLSGKQLGRILDVLRWTDYDPGEPDHGGQFWLLAHQAELGCMLRGLGQILSSEPFDEEVDPPDARQGFLASAQALLSACVMNTEDANSSTPPCMYRVELPAPAAA